jgi:hypothetical protein
MTQFQCFSPSGYGQKQVINADGPSQAARQWAARWAAGRLTNVSSTRVRVKVIGEDHKTLTFDVDLMYRVDTRVKLVRDKED